MINRLGMASGKRPKMPSGVGAGTASRLSSSLGEVIHRGLATGSRSSLTKVHGKKTACRGAAVGSTARRYSCTSKKVQKASAVGFSLRVEFAEGKKVLSGFVTGEALRSAYAEGVGSIPVNKGLAVGVARRASKAGGDNNEGSYGSVFR
jgi:hypothetical protein